MQELFDDDDYEPPADGERHDCPHCPATFPTADQRLLHRGLAHHDRLTEDEREAFRERYRAESEALRRFRIKALGVLVVCYFVFLFLFLALT